MNPSLNNGQDDYAPNLTKHTVRFWRPIFLGFSIIIGFSLTSWMLITASLAGATLGEKAFILIFVLYFGGLLVYVLNRYLACYNQVLQVSEANDTFYFGDDRLNKYNKDDIGRITIYQPGGVKKVHFFYVFEFTLKDGSMLKFSNMLISEAAVLNNFPDDLVSYGNKSPFWRL